MHNRKEHWDKVYTEKNPDEVSWYQKRPLLSLELIHRCHPQKSSAIIDVGGGASSLVDELLLEGYQDLTVLDISAQSLQIARQRLGNISEQVVWLESDVTTFSPAADYFLWHDRAVFHFLTDEQDQQQYVEVLSKSVKAGGFVIIAAFAPGGPTQCSGLDIVQYDSEKLIKVLGAGFQLLEVESELHMTPANKQQRFNYYRLFRQ